MKPKGIFNIIRAGIDKIVVPLEGYYYRKVKTEESFIFQGKTYKYFYHRYNTTWRNERAVEIPIIWDIVKKDKGQSILEVGNVLSHYFSISHDVVDKYERGEVVINEDVINFQHLNM